MYGKFLIIRIVNIFERLDKKFIVWFFLYSFRVLNRYYYKVLTGLRCHLLVDYHRLCMLFDPTTVIFTLYLLADDYTSFTSTSSFFSYFVSGLTFTNYFLYGLTIVIERCNILMFSTKKHTKFTKCLKWVSHI